MFQNSLRIFIAALLLFFSACSNHVHEEDSHGHGHGGTSVTQWNDRTEIFMEYPALVTGKEVAFAIHLSKMKDFKPVTEGTLTCIFKGNGGERLEVTEKAPSHPGIFRPVVSFSRAGHYEMELRLNSPQVSDTILVSGVRVYPDESDLPPEEAESGDSYISFLKEQQWKIDFCTEPARSRRLVGSIQAVGELLPKTQWHAEVPAPANGLILADQNAIIPSIGAWVRKGTVLAVISPPANSDYSLNHIRSEYLLASAEFERAQRLYKKQAIPEKRLEEARLKFEAKKAGYDIIARQIDFGNGASSEQAATPHFHLVAPIDGFIEEINFHIGENVQAGQRLFKITNPRRLLLKANVPTARISQVQAVSDASFRVEGYDREFVVSELNGSLVSVGSIVSETSRTVPVYFEFTNPQNLFKIGMFAEVSLKIDEPVNGLAIPRSAVFDEDGTPVAYVHVEGESFEKRILKTGISDRGYSQILSGLSEEERVVTVGGYQVRLASMSTSVPTGHGHVH
jgi:RND family efflux transporter MFP subunit